MGEREDDLEKESVTGDVEMELDDSGLPKSLDMDIYDHDLVSGGAITSSTEDLAEAMALNMKLADNDSLPEEEEDDYIIRPSDKIILVANAATDDSISTLEVRIYDESEGLLYVHHDISLPSVPLAISHLGRSVNKKNAVAIGTFNSAIEIWDLDVVNVLEPIAKLGMNVKNSKTANSEFTHTEGVIALDYSTLETNVLASGSADSAIRIWDIGSLAGVKKYSTTAKVLKVEFSPEEKNILLGCSFSGDAGVYDLRTPNVQNFKLSSKHELSSASWSEINPFQMFFGIDNGSVILRDLRKIDTNVFKFKAHNESCTAIAFNNVLKNIVATSSEDKFVRLWDVSKIDDQSYKKNSGLISHKEMAIGKIFDVSFSLDAPNILAAGGESGILAVWDFGEEESFKEFLRA